MRSRRHESKSRTHLAPVESKTTLAAYTARWAQGLQVARSTRDHYDIIVGRHIIPALGRRPLNTLRRTDIVIFVAEQPCDCLTLVSGGRLYETQDSSVVTD
jgi:hypothetical protein